MYHIMLVEAFLASVLDCSCKPGAVTSGHGYVQNNML